MLSTGMFTSIPAPPIPFHVHDIGETFEKELFSSVVLFHKSCSTVLPAGHPHPLDRLDHGVVQGHRVRVSGHAEVLTDLGGDHVAQGQELPVVPHRGAVHGVGAGRLDLKPRPGTMTEKKGL